MDMIEFKDILFFCPTPKDTFKYIESETLRDEEALNFLNINPEMLKKHK